MTTNPYESPESASTSELVEKKRFPIRKIVMRTVIGGLSALLLVAMLLPLNRGGRSREASRRNACINNLREISVALMNYAEVHGSYPPAYTVDDAGNRLHSWRTLILPFLDRKDVYELVDLSKPWDDPANAQARAAALNVYSCPSSRSDPDRTGYLGLVGPGCFFEGVRGRAKSEVPVGDAPIIALIEVDPTREVHWMSPHDADLTMANSILETEDRNHNLQSLIAFSNGAVEAMPEEPDVEELQQWQDRLTMDDIVMP